MFSNSYQSGFLSIFYSVGSNPLALWDKHVKNGHIRRVVDDDVKSLVLEIAGTNVATTYITCPIQARASLGVQLPFLVMVIKNMKRYFTFEIQILDDKDMRRRFRVSNFQSSTKVLPFCTTMPIGLSDGWNQVQFNLADFTKRAYGSTYMETTRVQIHANVRIRRIYFSDRLYSEEDMPNEFKLFAPGAKQKEAVPEKKKESISKPREVVEEPVPRRSVDRALEEVPPISTAPMDDDKKVPADIPAPSPVETSALNTSEVEMKSGEPETAEAPPPPEKEAAEGEAPAEGAEAAPAPASEEGAAEAAIPGEGGEAPSGAPTEETTEQEPAEAVEAEAEGHEPAAEDTTTEAATTEAAETETATTEAATTEPAEAAEVAEAATTETVTTEAPTEPADVEEPPSPEVATTEEPATTDAPTESEPDVAET